MSDDAALVDRLRAGDEAAFTALVRAEHGRLVRLARIFCRGCRATAEEVVQESWLAVLGGLGRYTGEARLGAWIAGIVVNKARTRAARDGRMVTFPDLARAELAADLQFPEAGRFREDGHWALAVEPWHAATPERIAADRELLRRLLDAVETLPPAQRAVLVLRDIEGHDGPEVCRLLGLTEGNMRVLLHRGRARLRAALDPLLRAAYLRGGRPGREDGGAAVAGGAAGP